MLRIRGLVATERVLREQLRSGIPRTQLEGFKRRVLSAVRAVEAALGRHGLTDVALPAPTRNAYRFLKAINLGNLPVTDAPAASSNRLVGISNVTASARWCSAALARLAAEPNYDPTAPKPIADRLAQTVGAVERICARHGATPASLNAPTRRAYAWLKFLTVPANLERHLDATRRTLSLARKLLALTGAAAPEVVVEFANSASLWRCTQRGRTLEVQMAEGLIAADDATLEAILRAILTGERANHRKRYVSFTATDAYRDVLLELDLAAEVDADQPRGVVYDLDELFDAVNAAYFGGEMTRPRLAWTDRLTSRRFGHFDPQRDRVVVSRTLDSERAPRFVVEYIVYHELLHRRLGSKWAGTRSRSHTPEFRREERKFARWREAEDWMRDPKAR